MGATSHSSGRNTRRNIGPDLSAECVASALTISAGMPNAASVPPSDTSNAAANCQWERSAANHSNVDELIPTTRRTIQRVSMAGP